MWIGWFPYVIFLCSSRYFPFHKGVQTFMFVCKPSCCAFMRFVTRACQCTSPFHKGVRTFVLGISFAHLGMITMILSIWAIREEFFMLYFCCQNLKEGWFLLLHRNFSCEYLIVLFFRGSKNNKCIWLLVWDNEMYFCE